MRPAVNVVVTNGNLNLAPVNENGVSVVLVACPVAPVVGYGVAFKIETKNQAITAFGQTGNEAVVDAFVNGFYAEAAEGTKVFVLAMANTTTLATLLAPVNADKALLLSNGSARLLAAIKFPAVGYTPTITQGFDQDVISAAAAATTLGNAWAVNHKGFRAFVQGFGYTNAADVADGRALTHNRTHIVVGSIDNSTARATLLALGRAAKIQPQENIGRVKSGSLNIPAAAAVKIGNTVAELVSPVDLDLLHDKGYITFERNAIAPGYVWNNDKSFTAVDDDYNNLRHGRVIDNAQRVAFRAYYEELKEDVNADEDGNLDALVQQSLRVKIESAIDSAMRGQLSQRRDGSSDVFVLVNPDPTEFASLYAAQNIDSPDLNIIRTGKVYIWLYVKPRGSLQYISVFLGLSAGN